MKDKDSLDTLPICEDDSCISELLSYSAETINVSGVTRWVNVEFSNVCKSGCADAERPLVKLVSFMMTLKIAF